MMMPSSMILTICISMALKRNRGLSSARYVDWKFLSGGWSRPPRQNFQSPVRGSSSTSGGLNPQLPDKSNAAGLLQLDDVWHQRQPQPTPTSRSKCRGAPQHQREKMRAHHAGPAAAALAPGPTACAFQARRADVQGTTRPAAVLLGWGLPCNLLLSLDVADCVRRTSTLAKWTLHWRHLGTVWYDHLHGDTVMPTEAKWWEYWTDIPVVYSV